MKHSLQTKLFISFMLVVALTLAGFAVGASVLVRQYFLSAKQQELVGKGHEGGAADRRLHCGPNDIDAAG